jgi:hypothetical protein
MGQNSMLKYGSRLGMILVLLVSLSACAKNRFPNLVVAEEGMVRQCQYLGTISDTSDPGKPVIDDQLAEYYDGELKVLQRADNMEATHIVWLYNYPIGSAASVYRCAE